MTTWLELAALPEGTRLRFKGPHDIFPECAVPAGTLCTLVENGLNEIWSAMLVMPDDANIRADLDYWGGRIHITGPAPEGPEEDPRWNDECPFEVVH